MTAFTAASGGDHNFDAYTGGSVVATAFAFLMLLSFGIALLIHLAFD